MTFLKKWNPADWSLFVLLTIALSYLIPYVTAPSSAQQQLSSTLVAYAYEPIAPTSAAALTLTAATVSPTTGPGAKGLYCTTETAPVRWRSDGTAPTTTEGHLVASPGVITLGDTNQILKFKVIAVSTTAAVKCSLLR